ncbi:MAG: hypothetical protein HUK20_09100 [Fibrobacter sp.]|nr:hypothetical protein [Fibrobacter sp.]
MNTNTQKKEPSQSRELRFFKKITGLPYLLVILALLMPIANVSCSDDKVIAEPTLYELASGLDLEQALAEPALGVIKKLQTGNPAALEKFKESIPNFPKMEPMPFLYVSIAGAVLAAVFAMFTPLGSIAMGMLTMLALSFFVANLAKLNAALGMQLLKVEPGIGMHAATALILIGTAMNLSSIIRPIIVEWKAKRNAKKQKS